MSWRRLGKRKVATLKTCWRRLQDMSWRLTNVCWALTQSVPLLSLILQLAYFLKHFSIFFSICIVIKGNSDRNWFTYAFHCFLWRFRGVFKILSNIWDGAFCENSWWLYTPLTIFTKSLILDVWLGSEHTSRYANNTKTFVKIIKQSSRRFFLK